MQAKLTPQTRTLIAFIMIPRIDDEITSIQSKNQSNIKMTAL